jgi:UDP-N-acetyl-D-glucosamine dehydrogenase
MPSNKHLTQLQKKLTTQTAQIGIVGLGYVGLPLAIAFADKGFTVLGLDVDPNKAESISAGRSYLKHIPKDRFAHHVTADRFSATTDFSKAADCDALIICVPTPLTDNREPDTSYIESTAHTLAKTLRPGQLIALESTTYPGTTDELLRGILEGESELTAGKDFFLVYSPEREDPGNPTYGTTNIPKVVGGYRPTCLKAGQALYASAVDTIVPVSSTRAAEMTKLFENIYRAVNIALVNELKLLCQRLDIDVWEVIEAASTKPFGFQAFYPGPGLGGHCIPIDPFYLTWKARQVDMSTRFIELAGEINTAMPYHVVNRVGDALNARKQALNGAIVLVLGVAYKPDVDDMRESPALKIIELLNERGAEVRYHDPHVPELTKSRKYDFDLKSVTLDDEALEAADCVLVVTNHRVIDYKRVANLSKIVVDTSGVVPKIHDGNVRA